MQSKVAVPERRLGLVAEDNGAVRVPAAVSASSRPRTLDAMWNLVEDIAKENAELRVSLDAMEQRVAVLEGQEHDARAAFDAAHPDDDSLPY